MNYSTWKIVVLACLFAHAWTFHHLGGLLGKRCSLSKQLRLSQEHEKYPIKSSPISPRDAAYSHIRSIGSILVKGSLFSGLISTASIGKAVADASFSSGPVAVLGSGGKTGQILIAKLAKNGYRVRPVFRGEPRGIDGLGDNAESALHADVTKIETLEEAISGASAVIFAASASKNGGNARQVDYLGVENVAKECVRLKIPRLVVISSGAVTKPSSLGFKITNLFGGIMNYKLQGENALRAIYKAADNKSLTYAIVRPGGLTDGSGVGPGKIELNQGDTISGEIARADVADCAAAAAVSNVLPTPGVVFEVYESRKRGPLQPEFPKVRNDTALVLL